jgi:hypothetical protein
VAKDLIIVVRDKPELYASLRQEFAGRAEVDVILDRRAGETASDARRDDRRSNQEAETLRTQGFVRVAARAAEAVAEFTEIQRTGPPTPQQVSGRTFTWTATVNRFPPRAWRDLFVDTKDRSIDFNPERIRFYQSVLIFESDEDKVPTWIQFINGWMRSANERYAKQLEAQRRAQEAREALNRDPKVRLREAAEKFKTL